MSKRLLGCLGAAMHGTSLDCDYTKKILSVNTATTLRSTNRFLVHLHSYSLLRLQPRE